MTRPRQIQVTRYITPLREGGSLPAIVDGDDGFMYALKFKGSGQGIKTLIAELIGGLIAQQLGLKLPEIVFAELDEAFGRTEPDEEIQDLLKASRGLNLGLHYLSGAVTFDPAVNTVDPLMASKIVWLDAFIMNVDRTARNTNMLMWGKELWLIDHGASLYFHHNWPSWEQQSKSPFGMISHHVLLSQATLLKDADTHAAAVITDDFIDAVTAAIPDAWLEQIDEAADIMEARAVYNDFLKQRMQHRNIFVNQAIHANAGTI